MTSEAARLNVIKAARALWLAMNVLETFEAEGEVMQREDYNLLDALRKHSAVREWFKNVDASHASHA